MSESDEMGSDSLSARLFSFVFKGNGEVNPLKMRDLGVDLSDLQS
jgi:hypothetical protein